MIISDSAVILAGGKSSRFGTDKAFASYRGTPLIERILRQLNSVFNQVVIVSNDPEKYNIYDVELTTDLVKTGGPLCGLHSGLKAVSADYVYLTACDMPFISSELIDLMRMVIEIESKDAVLVKWNGILQPFNAFYSRKLIPVIEQVLLCKNGSMYSLLDQIDPSVIALSSSSDDCGSIDVFTNINRKSDMEHLAAQQFSRNGCKEPGIETLPSFPSGNR